MTPLSMGSPLDPPTRESVRRGLRRGRLQELALTQGCDPECRVPEMFDGTSRWAIMFERERTGDVWWDHAPGWRVLLDRALELESDWRAVRLYDLDSGWQTNVRLRYEPVANPEEAR